MLGESGGKIARVPSPVMSVLCTMAINVGPLGPVVSSLKSDPAKREKA